MPGAARYRHLGLTDLKRRFSAIKTPNLANRDNLGKSEQDYHEKDKISKMKTLILLILKILLIPLISC